MHRRFNLAVWILLLIFGTLVSSNATTLDDAWQELHALNTSAAKQLFERAQIEDPNNEACKRGLFLSASLDMDHSAMGKALFALGGAPGDPFLPAMYEWLVAQETDWSDYASMRQRLSSLLSKSPYGAHRFNSEMMERGLEEISAFKAPTKRRPSMPAGAWCIGPFENQSNIAFYRELPIERAPLDTTLSTTGTMGMRVGWCWLESDVYGQLAPTTAFQANGSNVYLLRLFFELPTDAEILILPGGIYSGRFSVDGTLLHSDPVHRNSFIQEGFKVRLARGIHELSMTLGNNDFIVECHLDIRNADYSVIPGFKWLRFANVTPDRSLSATPFHPIFDIYDSLTTNRTDPDIRFWWGVLQMYNGRCDEAVTRFEELLASEKLTPLELLLLTRMLETQQNQGRQNEILGMIASTHCPTVLLEWCMTTYGTTAEQIDAALVLAQTYPDRVLIESFANTKHLLSGDVQAYKSGLASLQRKHPASAIVDLLLLQLYEDVIHDYVTAFKIFGEYCRKTSQGMRYLAGSPQYYVKMQKYPEAITALREFLRGAPISSDVFAELVDAALAAHTPQSVIPDIEALLKKYPYNTVAMSQLYDLYRQAGDNQAAESQLRRIHEVKPTAPTPYMRLSELRHHVSLDSLFGSVDVESLWQVTPTSEELGGNNSWMLLDRTQKVVFDSGPVCVDHHTVVVVEDREAVQDYQEVSQPVDESDGFSNLLCARRLRKGMPPLNGEKNGETIVFKDLRPGDAVELRYRWWQNQRGDLWNEFTDHYSAYSESFQRYWEYTIFTDRADLVTRSIAPAPEPTIDSQYGFSRMKWSADRAEAWHLDLKMLPPEGDLVGRIVVSTIKDWQLLNQWYYSISEAILDNNPRAAELARKLTADLTTDQDKASALYRFVSMDIPYQVIEFDYHSSIPQKPDEVLARRWGDCKDKAHLFIAMARHVGLKAWPVLVLTSKYKSTLPLPEFDFNHLIAACTIDGDTLFLDLTATHFPFDYTILRSTASQPMLLVSETPVSALGTLPPLSPDNIRLVDTMEIWLESSPASRLELRVLHERMSAGTRRSAYAGHTPETAKQQIQTNASNAWKVQVTLDSIAFDSTETIENQFGERWWGNVTLRAQQVGGMTLLTLPAWAPFSDGLFASLTWQGKREFPVTLRYDAGTSNWSVRLHVPPAYGEPKLSPPLTINGSLLNFVHNSHWDKVNRVLTLGYNIKIHDGMTDVETFSKFAHKVKETFDNPVVFSGTLD